MKERARMFKIRSIGTILSLSISLVIIVVVISSIFWVSSSTYETCLALQSKI